MSNSGYSILIGPYTSTSGYSNSIAIGSGATNTATNQFLISNQITQMSLRGLNYTLPTTQTGGTLINDGSGILTWEPISLIDYIESGVTGNGVSSGYTITHNLGYEYVDVRFFLVTTKERINMDYTTIDTNTIYVSGNVLSIGEQVRIIVKK